MHFTRIKWFPNPSDNSEAKLITKHPWGTDEGSKLLPEKAFSANEKLYRRIKWKNHPLENSLNRKSLFCRSRNVFGAFYPADQRPFARVLAFHGNFKLYHRDCNFLSINGLSETHSCRHEIMFPFKSSWIREKSQHSWSFIFVAQIK